MAAGKEPLSFEKIEPVLPNVAGFELTPENLSPPQGAASTDGENTNGF
jgi:hypothetical protein